MLQQDLSKFFKPITETQKAATKNITEGLKPIKEGIEQLPQKLPQQIGYPLPAPSSAPPSYRSASPPGSVAEFELKEPLSSTEKKELQQQIDNFILAYPDNVFGFYEKRGEIYMGNMPAEIFKGNIIFNKYEKNTFKLTDGLKNLIFYREHDPNTYTANDFSMYSKILKLTGAMHHNNDPSNPHFKFREIDPSLSDKARIIKEDIWNPYTKTEQFKKKHTKTLTKTIRKRNYSYPI